jgi:PPP family 3-phenylpropionic acid transporter
MFLLIGVYLPFFPAWLKSRGLGAGQISVILAAPMLARIIFTPAISFLADRMGDRRRALLLLIAGSLLSLLAMPALRGFPSLLLAATLFGILWASIMPLTEAMAMSSVKAAGLDYGRVRLWGSLSFILASSGSGLIIDRLGEQSVLPLMLAAAGLTLLIASKLPKADRKSGGEALEKIHAGPPPPIHWREALRLAHSPLFLLFLLAASTIQASHAIYYGFGSLHWRSLGMAAGTIGALWAIGVIAEISLFAWSKPVIERLGPTKMLIMAAMAGILRWGVDSLDPPLAVLVISQCLHAFTYGAAHLGAIHFISKAVPDQLAATGQGLYAAFAMGAVMGLTTAFAGSLHDALQAHAYLVMAAMSALSLACALLLHRKWRGQTVIAAPSSAAARQR